MPAHFNPEFDPADVNTDYGSTGGDITVPTFTADYSPFKFWCQKTLPLVFDDSLSYYEVLCKLVTYVNNLLTDLQTATGSIGTFAQQFVVNQQFLNQMAERLGTNTAQLESYINDRMEDFSEAYASLQEYVNTYFANLDVQEEINTKLDEMAQDGTLDTLLQPFTEDWLENMTEEIRTDLANQNQTLATQNSRISVLEGRMDTFAALPAGSTSGNAELLDIRTNFLGETFGSAGDAVRASDLIASGYIALPFTNLTGGTVDSATYAIDVSKYKGGRIAFIGNFFVNAPFFEYPAGTDSSIFRGNNSATYSGSTKLLANSFEDFTYKIETEYAAADPSLPIQQQVRMMCSFTIPDDFSYQYLLVEGAQNGITGAILPYFIIYGTYWIETPIDPTLTQAGEAADAKATGDAIAEINERLSIDSGALGAERTYTATTSTTGSDVTFATMFLAKDHTYKFSAVLPLSYQHNIYFKVFQRGTENKLLQINLVSGATTGTGTITPIEDMDVELKMYISSATETSISVTVIDQDGIATDVKQIAFNISPLSDSVFKFNDYFTFKNGGMSQGGWVSSTPYRVMCDTIMRFDFDITLQIANGFKYGVHTFVNGSFASDSGWQTGSYKITAGTYFKVVVARYTEITSETANVDLFASMITVVANDALVTNAKISTLTDNLLAGTREIVLPTWEQGGIAGNGQISVSNNDIRSIYALHIPAGEYWVNPNGIALYYFYYSSVGAYIENCSVDRKWGVTNPFKINFTTDKYIKFVQARSSGITPAEATLQITQVIPKAPLGFQHYKNGITIMSKAGEGLDVPPQSLLSVKEAFKNLYDGYRINVCKTSDGYYVCSHDRSINSIARNSDNTQISETINIDEHTLAELNQYDYGIKYGVAFAGTQIALFSDTVALCAKLGLKLDIEWKYPTMTQADIEAIYDAIVTNGYSNKNWHWIAKNATEIGYFKSVCDYVDIEVLVSSHSVNYYLPLINEAKSDNHDVIVGYSDGNYSDENIIILRKLNIIQNKGTASNITQMIAQIESGVTEIECNFYNPKQALINYALSN